MLRFTVQTTGRFIAALIAVSIFVFAIVRLLPGDTLTTLWADRDYTPQELHAERARLGLNKPLYAQYFVWTGNVLTGDLGKSLRTHQQIAGDLRQRIPVTLELTLYATAVAAAVGITGGLLSAFLRRTVLDHTFKSLAMLGLSLPSFLVASLALLILSKYFHWIPPQRFAQFVDDPITNVQQYLLPSLILGFWGAAILLRMTRTAVLDVLPLEYVRTAYAKGLSSRAVAWRHVMRNAWPPVIVMLGLMFAQLVSGSVVIEAIFGLPGLGSYVLQAVNARDYGVIQAVALVITLGVVLANAAADLIVGLADPRVRTGA